MLAALTLTDEMTFDDLFPKLVRLTGWGLGVYAVVAGKLSGAETVAVIVGFVGFEFVVNARDKKLSEIVGRGENGGG